jgi:hypothetical protein
MRRVVSPLVVVVCLAALASAAYARSPKDPVLHKRAADVALARRLLVGTGDLPAGFRDAGSDRSGTNSNIECKGVAQPDLHRLVMTADVTSHDFQRTDTLSGYTMVNSEATLFRSAREAQASISWLVKAPKAKLNACFAAAVRAGLPKTAKSSGFHLTASRRTSGDLHLYAWEIGLRFQRSGHWIPVDMLITGYRRGRALEMLMAVDAGGGLDPVLTADLSRTIIGHLTQASL